MSNLKSEPQISLRNISETQIGPAYLGSDQLGGILGMGIFLREDIVPEYLGLSHLGGIFGVPLFLEEVYSP